MWLRCLVLSALFLALVSSADVPEKEIIKTSEEHTKEKETDEKETEAVIERGGGHNTRPLKPWKELPDTGHPKEPKHPIKDGMISGVVLVPLGLGHQPGHSIGHQQSAISLDVFKQQVAVITKQIEELRSNLKMLLVKYQSQRNANMKILIRKYKFGIQRLVSDRLRIESLIKCVLNPGVSGCGASEVTSGHIVEGGSSLHSSSTLEQINAGRITDKFQNNYPVGVPYPIQYPATYPQYENYDWAKIASQLAVLNQKYMGSNQNLGVGLGYGGANYPAPSPTVNVFNGHSSYGMKGSSGVSSGYNMGQGYAKGPLYYPPGFVGNQPLNPGSYVDQGNMNLGMSSSYGKDYFNMMGRESGLTSSELLGSFEGDTSSSLFESSLLGTENLSELDETFGIGDFESQQVGGGLKGYGQVIGYLIPQRDFLPQEDGRKPVEPPGIPDDEVEFIKPGVKPDHINRPKPGYENPIGIP